MNAAARDHVFIPCCVYIPAVPPLMGLESLKMCFSRPGMLLAGRMCRDLCIFDAALGRSGTLKRLHDLLRERWNSDEPSCHKKEKNLSLILSVCQKYAKSFSWAFLLVFWSLREERECARLSYYMKASS